MSKIVDARGLACPQPVILTRNALQENDQVTTIVDNKTSQYNVTKMAEKGGHQVKVEKKNYGIYLHISKESVPQESEAAKPTSSGTDGPIVLVISNEFMGHGDNELGHILIRGLCHILGEVESLPDTIIFFNTGVKLVVEGSPVLEDLQALQKRGVDILACGTCLEHFELNKKLVVGEVSNMYTIAETMLGTGKVVNL